MIKNTAIGYTISQMTTAYFYGGRPELLKILEKADLENSDLKRFSEEVLRLPEGVVIIKYVSVTNVSGTKGQDPDQREDLINTIKEEGSLDKPEVLSPLGNILLSFSKKNVTWPTVTLDPVRDGLYMHIQKPERSTLIGRFMASMKVEFLPLGPDFGKKNEKAILFGSIEVMRAERIERVKEHRTRSTIGEMAAV